MGMRITEMIEQRAARGREGQALASSKDGTRRPLYVITYGLSHIRGSLAHMPKSQVAAET